MNTKYKIIVLGLVLSFQAMSPNPKGISPQVPNIKIPILSPNSHLKNAGTPILNN